MSKLFLKTRWSGGTERVRPLGTGQVPQMTRALEIARQSPFSSSLKVTGEAICHVYLNFEFRMIIKNVRPGIPVPGRLALTLNNV